MGREAGKACDALDLAGRVVAALSVLVHLPPSDPRSDRVFGQTAIPIGCRL